MAISKIIYKSSAEDTGTVWMDTTDKTVAADKMVSGITALKNDGTTVTGNLTSRSSSDLTASGATVTVPAGVYSSQTSKAVSSGSASTPATTITANPSISVNSSTGVITATASATQSVTPTVSAGYVSSGTAGTITVSGSNTSNLTTQAAQTIHPSTTAQSIASGKYLTGAQTIAAVVLENLTAGNIKKDVVVKIGDADDDDCVASVTGTYEGGGGGTTWETVYTGSASCSDPWGNGYYAAYISSWSEIITLNSVWKVTWDSVEYECTATWEGSNDGDPYALGNYTYDGGSGGTDYPFFIQAYGTTLIVIGASGTHTIKIEKQVSGGGSSFTLLYSAEVSVNTSSTSSTLVSTITTGVTFETGKTYLVSIRDKAGKRNGYFYGSNELFIANTLTSSTIINHMCFGYNSSGNLVNVSSGNGVYNNRYYCGSNMGNIEIYSKYNSSYGTIDGTFTVKLYEVNMPEELP